ncbi:MAG: SDR family NAD(P)-dependent oxidoreductase [Verrucomicrobiae bacterium]|nr:SDR family NAD(P)-dependent oxidoreductase [Verrucomicrobiae bacterium]
MIFHERLVTCRPKRYVVCRMSLVPPSNPSVPNALILGASGVLGRALAVAFRNAGYRALGTGFRQVPDGDEVFQFDATQTLEIARLAAWVERVAPKLDVIVHAIGGTHDQLVMRMSDQEWHKTLEQNLGSAFRVARAMWGHLAAGGGGQMIFVGSWAGRTGRGGQGAYAAAKAGVIALCQSMAREGAGAGIRVNCVVPGYFPSPMTTGLTPEALARLGADAVKPGFSNVEEMVSFMVHLAGMRGVTGQVFQLDGRIAPALS